MTDEVPCPDCYLENLMDKALYFGCFNGKLYHVALDTGKINWTYQTYASKENYSKVFDSDDCKIKGLEDSYHWDMAAFYNVFHSLGSILSSPVVDQNVVYFRSTDGYYYALR